MSQPCPIATVRVGANLVERGISAARGYRTDSPDETLLRFCRRPRGAALSHRLGPRLGRARAGKQDADGQKAADGTVHRHAPPWCSSILDRKSLTAGENTGWAGNTPPKALNCGVNYVAN